MRSLAAFSLLLLLVSSATAAPTQTIDPADEPPLIAAPELPTAEPGVIELFRSFGLFGTFAPDCGKPAEPANPHVSVTEEQGGLVIETHDVGRDYATNLYSIRTAKKSGTNRLEINAVFVPGTDTHAEVFQTLELLVGKGTRRTMFNRVDGGAVRVRRGIAVANGSKTPLLKKCD